MKLKLFSLLPVTTALLSPALAHAQLYSEDFDADHTASWTVNSGPGANLANFFFDYSSVGIPSAPHSSGGSTLGLRLNANLDVAVQALGGISVSPTGQSFGGDYQLRFDLWLNFNGPAPVGGSGSTQIGGGGIGSSGTVANYAGVADGVWFSGSGDGNSSADFRAYTPAFPASLVDASGVYTANSRNQSAALYTAAFPTRTAPAAQTALFPQQTGSALAGSLAWQWHDVKIDKIGNIVTWNMDGVLLATLDLSTNGTLGGSNILLQQSDINTTASTDVNRTNLIFGLFDNVVVSAVPEPSVALITFGAVATMGFVRRIRRARRNG
jgi:hypothetical protein